VTGSMRALRRSEWAQLSRRRAGRSGHRCRSAADIPCVRTRREATRGSIASQVMRSFDLAWPMTPRPGARALRGGEPQAVCSVAGACSVGHPDSYPCCGSTEPSVVAGVRGGTGPRSTPTRLRREATVAYPLIEGPDRSTGHRRRPAPESPFCAGRTMGRPHIAAPTSPAMTPAARELPAEKS
jgi:hypothetical protein